MVIVAETVEMEAHRVVLAACSPYFCAMFTGTALCTRPCARVEGAGSSAEPPVGAEQRQEAWPGEISTARSTLRCV